MNLPKAPAGYDQNDQAKMRGALASADDQNRKINADIEVGTNCRVILTDTDDSKRYALTLAAGAIVLTLLS